MGSVVTSMPLDTDRPIDAGIARFCDSCRACRKFCPPQAIPDERSPEAGKDHLGYDRYVVDTGRCFPYFAKHSYCSVCLPVCAYNHKEWAKDFDAFQTKLFPQVLMPDAPPPVDLPQEEARHFYARIHRS
jgi:epoxyqueuosine reductase QueG